MKKYELVIYDATLGEDDKPTYHNFSAKDDSAAKLESAKIIENHVNKLPNAEVFAHLWAVSPIGRSKWVIDAWPHDMQNWPLEDI